MVSDTAIEVMESVICCKKSPWSCSFWHSAGAKLRSKIGESEEFANSSRASKGHLAVLFEHFLPSCCRFSALIMALK